MELHNSDRHFATARTFKCAPVLIWSVRFNSRKPHVGAALGAPRVEDAPWRDFRFARPIQHGVKLAEMLSQSLDASAIRLDYSDSIAQRSLLSSSSPGMSAFGGKADIARTCGNVCF